MSQKDTLKRPYGNHQRLESQQEVQTPGGKGSQDKGESSHYSGHRRTTEPDRAYSDSFGHKRSKWTRLPSCFTPFHHQHISGQELPFFTILGSFQEKTSIKGPKNISFNQRQKQSEPMFQRLLDLVKEVHKSQK
ncbi:hypothetical protein O181_002052 [Austropuccinia psidii MF-1]|uniref:Uncharacterized protein n=1 Tax=Austropuccinia psidii MF-1 TaxID=1389203 RepID=A0A9Q3BBR4_9BASI|nr:hypothetical protein [Austropuccinia psidii MF-1]